MHQIRQQIRKRLQLIILLMGIFTAAFIFYDGEEKELQIKPLISHEWDSSMFDTDKQKKDPDRRIHAGTR